MRQHASDRPHLLPTGMAAVHVASAAVVAPVGRYWPAAHAVPVHAAALERPVCALYVPAAQACARRSPGQ